MEAMRCPNCNLPAEKFHRRGGARDGRPIFHCLFDRSGRPLPGEEASAAKAVRILGADDFYEAVQIALEIGKRDEEIERLTEELRKAREEQAEMRLDAGGSQSELAKAQTQITRQGEMLNETRRDLQAFMTRRKALEAEVESLKRDLADRDARIVRQTQEIANHVSANLRIAESRAVCKAKLEEMTENVKPLEEEIARQHDRIIELQTELLLAKQETGAPVTDIRDAAHVRQRTGG